MKHFNGILFQKSEPANKQHANHLLCVGCLNEQGTVTPTVVEERNTV